MTSFNKIFLILFSFFSIYIFFLILRDQTYYTSPYTFGGWMISYTGQGFTKILGGELLLFISKILSIKIQHAYILVNFILYLIILFALIKKFWPLAEDIKVLSIFFPTSFVFLTIEQSLIGRLEVVLIAYVSIIYLFLKNKFHYIPNNRIIFLNGIFLGVLLMFHKSFITFTPLLFLVVLKYLKINYQFFDLIKKFLVFYLPQVFILFLILYFTPNLNEIKLEPIFQNLPEDVSIRLREFSDSSIGYIWYVNKPIVAIIKTVEDNFFFISSLIFNLIINSLFLIFIFATQKFKFEKIDYYIILYLFIYISIFFIYSDWARYFFIQNMIILFFLNEEKIMKINSKFLIFFSFFLPLLAIHHGINNKFSMNFIQTLDFLINRSLHYLSVIF